MAFKASPRVRNRLSRIKLQPMSIKFGHGRTPMNCWTSYKGRGGGCNGGALIFFLLSGFGRSFNSRGTGEGESVGERDATRFAGSMALLALGEEPDIGFGGPLN